MVARGVDPMQADKKRREDAVDLAFVAYLDTFTTGYLKKNWKDWQGAESVLRKDPSSVLKDKPLPEITRSDIVAVLDRYGDRPAAGERAFALLRKLFNWAEGRGEIERSPIGKTFPAPRSGAARDRVLSDEELTLYWNATDAIGYPFGPMFRLLLLTGCRRAEASGLSWSELDRQACTWSLPPARSKNGQAHIIPLNDLAIAEIDAHPLTQTEGGEVIWPKSGYVFTTTSDRPVSGYSRAKQRLDTEIEKKAEGVLEPWRLHDVRRTVATGLQKLGVRFEVTEAILNHISGARGGVAGVYQRHDWKDEKQSALDAWGRHLTSLSGNSDRVNVIELRQGA